MSTAAREEGKVLPAALGKMEAEESSVERNGPRQVGDIEPHVPQHRLV